MADTAESGADRPLFTIAVTCFNAEGTIERAVRSALAQTWSPREIVVVDDASTDGSAVLLREFERTHDEIRVIRHDSNRGVAEARNTLLAHARGAVIAFFDDDDESVPGRLEQQYRASSITSRSTRLRLCSAIRTEMSCIQGNAAAHR